MANDTPSHRELLGILNQHLLQENSPFPQIFPSILLQVTQLSALTQIAGFYPQSRKAKRSLQIFNYMKSSGDPRSFAASQTPQGHPFAVEAPSLACATPQPLSHRTKDCGRTQRRHLGTFLIVLLCCGSSNTTQHPGSRTAGFYGECSSNFSTRLGNHPTGPFSCFSILLQNK